MLFTIGHQALIGTKTVRLAGGGTTYDRLVLSPGIDFVDGAVPGWDFLPKCMPHAYKAGSQTELLKRQVDDEAGEPVMVAPLTHTDAHWTLRTGFNGSPR